MAEIKKVEEMRISMMIRGGIIRGTQGDSRVRQTWCQS